MVCGGVYRLHGSYEALEGGQSMDAMVDLTGGLAERFDLEDTPDKRRFFKLLMTASRGAFITASRKVKAIRGEWVAGSTAGGSRNDFEKFATNPQFLLKVDEAESDGSEGLNGSCSVLVAVMQEHRRSRRDFGVKMLQIGFVVYKTRDPTKPLPADYFYHHYEESSSGVYINYREVLARLELTPGCYSIIPATFTPDTPGQFMVRVYSPRPFHLSPLPPPTTPPAASEG
ncbi:calpain-9-like [Portunus trituberculatus]|uniref:calpain-9-like n=1 Tax=Portunus trituberculatus TaxID=210409 RepID=UPI001E1CF8AC|nr:calpain-9-like [Portunus trituberculatus]